MHIPDGYLSPSTCATLYAGSAPFWYVALRRAERALSSRMIPLLSVFAAFSFVVMMFNLPLPGGTTGHAVGMAMAAIVLGPWLSILAVSIALLVQALLFGDGGITTYGANCFNMAIVGSIVSFAVYRLMAYRAALTANRRALAAGLAGYIGINCAAFCAAIEFGIQPLLFHNASGTPLYAPYPLSVSIPAMMIGHLTFAGFAEFVLSAGMVGYIQRTDPDLLRATAPEVTVEESTSLLPVSRRLWLALAIFLILTPLGILATGSAWGEARVKQFWNAPLSDYAPRFIHSPFFGYFVSAAIGVGVIALVFLAATMLLHRTHTHRKPIRFIEKTIQRLTRAADEALFAEESARADGLLQRIDPRAKMAGLGSLLIATVAVHQLKALALIFVLGCILALCSRVGLRVLGLRVWLPVFVFTGLIAVPALFLTPGRVLLWSVTFQGLETATLLLLRTECAVTLTFLLIVTTYWSHILRSLRWFRIPASVVALLEITYRYIFVLLQSAGHLFESRQTRVIGRMEPSEQRRFASSAAVVLLEKTFLLSSDVHLAMQARGFRGNIVLLEDLRMSPANWLQTTFLIAASIAIVCWGR